MWLTFFCLHSARNEVEIANNRDPCYLSFFLLYVSVTYCSFTWMISLGDDRMAMKLNYSFGLSFDLFASQYLDLSLIIEWLRAILAWTIWITRPHWVLTWWSEGGWNRFFNVSWANWGAKIHCCWYDRHDWHIISCNLVKLTFTLKGTTPLEFILDGLDLWSSTRDLLFVSKLFLLLSHRIRNGTNNL